MAYKQLLNYAAMTSWMRVSFIGDSMKSDIPVTSRIITADPFLVANHCTLPSISFYSNLLMHSPFDLEIPATRLLPEIDRLTSPRAIHDFLWTKHPQEPTHASGHVDPVSAPAMQNHRSSQLSLQMVMTKLF